MEICPVKTCQHSFLNKYSLTNHLHRNSDPEHVTYYQTYVVKKTCPSCSKKLDNRRKFYEGLCYTCFKKQEIKPIIKKDFIKKICFNCKKEVEDFFSKMNSRVLCPDCRELSIEHDYLSKRSSDIIRNAKDKEIRRENKLEKNKEKIINLYEMLQSDLMSDLPIYKICGKHHISLLSIRKVLPLLMSDLEYEKRNHEVRSKATQARIEEIKNYFKNRPDPRKLHRNPSSLELRIGRQILKFFPEAKIRYNVWKALKDDLNNCFIHLESDVIINFDADIRIIILCDGEAFHGEKSYFCGDTTKTDEWKSRILHKFNPFVLRYSETEIKKNEALNHCLKIIQNILDKKVKRYYRNWMLNIEEIE